MYVCGKTRGKNKEEKKKDDRKDGGDERVGFGVGGLVRMTGERKGSGLLLLSQ